MSSHPKNESHNTNRLKLTAISENRSIGTPCSRCLNNVLFWEKVTAALKKKGGGR